MAPKIGAALIPDMTDSIPPSSPGKRLKTGPVRAPMPHANRSPRQSARTEDHRMRAQLTLQH
jgi:hypothetical protein